MSTNLNHRILIVDDTRSIHDDFRKILARADRSASRSLDAQESALFGTTPPPEPAVDLPDYAIDSAYQGEDALRMVRQAHEAGTPYAVVFMDVRMPPGWDGIETIGRIWREFPHVETVICTAYSDYGWEEIVARLGRTDRLLFLSKPFDATAVKQMALTLTRKWNQDAAVRRQVQALENDARLRSAQLSSSQDEVAQKSQQLQAAEQASRAKSAFVANMSHEIRTPLTAIVGFAESLLQDDLAGPERERATRTIVRNAHHLLDIVNDILDLSKIEAGMLQLDPQRFAPGDLLHDVETILRLRASEKGLTLTARQVAEIPRHVVADRLRLKQVLLNLGSNAIKFTPTGHVTLELSYDESARRLAFRVSDTGIGMDAAQLARVFQPFVQGDSTITRRFGGTGLGLSICAQLVQMLGGTIRAESTPGQGSTFAFDIKAPVVEVIESAASAEPGAAVAPPSPPRLAGHVLVVEDVSDNQQLINLWLRKIGVTCEFADNGAAGVVRARNGRFDLVFMDVEMPVMDGLTATRQLRAEGFKTPIVALTANALNEDRALAGSVGFDDYVPKPINRAALYAVLTQYLKPHAATADGTTG